MNTRMFRVGLTGGIASGKSTVGEFFRELGVPLIDPEHLLHHAWQAPHPPLERLVERFGRSILTPCGHLDAPALRNIVFSQPKARIDLEVLAHSSMRAAVEAESARAGGPYQVLISRWSLHESLAVLLDRVLRIDCERDLRIRRLQTRDNTTLERASAVMYTEATRTSSLMTVDDIVMNNGDMGALREQITALHCRYLTLAGYSRPGVAVRTKANRKLI